MPKNNFLSWDTIANSNEDVGGVNIKEGCAPSGINNAIREIMAQLRADIDGGMVYAAKAANYTAVANDNNGYIRFTAAATLSLTAVATLGADWHVFVQADGGDVIVDPNAAETINGAATITIRNGESALIISNGSAFFARINALATVTYAEKSGNYTAVAADNRGTLRFTAAATLALTAAATLGSAWRTTVINSSSGLVTIDPNASETVNGTATSIIGPGQTATIVCSGTAFFADIHSDPLSGPQLQGYSTGLVLTTNGADATNDVDIAVGVAASDVSPYYLMQLASAMTKRLDAAWVVGTNQGGLDTGAVGNNTYYIWLIQRSDTGIVDVLFSLSSTAPTMPTSYDRKRLIGQLTRASAANGGPASLLIDSSIKMPSVALTASGTAVDVVGIPAGVKRVTIILGGVTVSGTSQLSLKLGTSGGVVSTGYFSTAIGATTGVTNATSTTQFVLGNSSTASNFNGHVILSRLATSSNTWVMSGLFNAYTISGLLLSGGSLPLGGELDRIQITTAAGSVTLGGPFNISWEY